MAKNSAQILIDALGLQTVLSFPGMTERNVRHARSVGYFSARWYKPLKSVADARGIDCPLDAFSFKDLPKKHVNRIAALQESGNPDLDGNAA